MSHDNIKYKRKLWRSPKSWKEADKNSKYLKDTPTPYKDPWKKYDDKKTIKSIREDSKKIIDEELGDLLWLYVTQNALYSIDAKIKYHNRYVYLT